MLVLNTIINDYYIFAAKKIIMINNMLKMRFNMKYKISDLSKLLNVSTNTVRRYEELGYISSYRDEKNGYRYYSEDDITKFMNARLLRKYGFTHSDIANMMSYDMNELKSSYEERMEKIDEQIEYLQNLRHCMKDDIGMMGKIDIYQQPNYRRECVPLYYVLYQSGDKILKENRRLRTVQDFLYQSPEVHRIFLIRKEDIEADNVSLNMGWAVKVADLDRFKIEKNEFVEIYEKRESLLRLAKLPVESEKINICNGSELKNMLIKEPIQYMEEHHLKLVGDIIGIAIAIVIENNIEMQYVLVNFPIAEM